MSFALAAPRSAAAGVDADGHVLLSARPKARRGGLFGWRGSVSTPLEQRVPKGIGHALVIGFFLLVGGTGAVMGGHVEDFRETYGEPKDAMARLVGLGITRVSMTGITQLHQAEVLDAAGITENSSLVFLDAADVRRRLEAVPLIKEASVRKLYPNELSISLTERQPTAIWQKDGELFTVAGDGTVIDKVHDMRFARLPFVVGEGANARSQEYVDLLEAAGALKGRVRAGMLVSNRRWTLKLDNNIDVKLPEKGAKEALARFVAIERDQRLTDKDILSVDMRQPDRITVKQTAEAAAARSEMLKKKAKQPKGAEVI